MVKNVLLGFATVALAIASAASSYKVTFFQPVLINGTQLKPGDYKLELKGDNTAVLKQGKLTTEAPVKVETADKKFSHSSVLINGDQVQEIRLGGTETRVVFETSDNATK
ncbi:MAG TPA: hypothetical protein VME17_14925 [Bryobacteraceae bacterium]|nr:hypothetical protein [Bryobacteraceae bacterium]